MTVMVYYQHTQRKECHCIFVKNVVFLDKLDVDYHIINCIDSRGSNEDEEPIRSDRNKKLGDPSLINRYYKIKCSAKEVDVPTSLVEAIADAIIEGFNKEKFTLFTDKKNKKIYEYTHEETRHIVNEDVRKEIEKFANKLVEIEESSKKHRLGKGSFRETK